MQKNEKITPMHLGILIILNKLILSFSFIPTATLAPANQDAWIADLLSGVFIFAIAIPFLIMANRFKEKAFNEYFEIILGKPIGKVINTLYALALIFICILSILILSDFLLSAVLPETPLYAIFIMMIIPCIYAVYKGIESIGRASIIMGVVVIGIIVLYFILNINNMDFKYFKPILKDSSVYDISYGALNTAGRFADVLLFFLFLGYTVKDKKFKITKSFLTIVIISTLISTVITIATQSVLGTGLTKILRYPYFASIQQISMFDIIQRIEFFNVLGWIIIFLFKISTTMLAALLLLQGIFHTKSYRPFMIPINVVIAIVVIFTNISYFAILRDLVNQYLYFGIFVFTFIIPLLVLFIYLIRSNALKKVE